jgi:hypothetical protein
MIFSVVLHVWERGATAPQEVIVTLMGEDPESAASNAVTTVIETYHPDTVEVKHVRGVYHTNRVPYPVSGAVVRW